MKRYLILLICLLLPITAIFSQQVTVEFVVSDGVGGEQILKAGVDLSATDGLDVAFGEAELPPLPPTGVYDGRFVLPDPSDETVTSLNDFRYGNIIPSNEGFITEHKLTSQLGTGSSELTLCWDIEGVNLNFKDNVTGELFNEDITTSGPGCYTVPLGLTTVIVSIEYTKSPIPSELNISPTSLLLGASTGSFGDFNISSNVNWSVSSNVSWLSVSPTSGSDDGTVRVTANSTNPTINERIGTVTVVGGGLTKTVNVTQSSSPAELILTPSNRGVTSSSGSTTFDISSNVSWTVTDNAEWLTVLPASGLTSGALAASYSENILLTQRVATITVTGGGIARTATVTQAGASPVLTVAPTSLTLGSASGSTDSISVSSNISWTVTDNAAWLIVSPAGGSNNGSVTVTSTSANTSLSSRTGTVTITGSGIAREVTVAQAGANPVLTVSPDSLLLENNAGSFGDFSVSSNVDWTVSHNQDWLMVAPMSGSNNENIRATTTTDNLSTTETRIDTITIAGEGITQFVVVAQSPTIASLVATPDSVAIGSEIGSVANINISSNISWSVNSDAEWLSVSPIDGFGDSIVVVTATTANPSAVESRDALVTISGSEIIQTVKVTQFPAGALLSVSPDSLELGSEAGSYGDVSITSNVNWSANTNVTWLSVSPTSGTNNSDVRITADSSNLLTNYRSGEVTIAGGGISIQVLVLQIGTIDSLPPATPIGFTATVINVTFGVYLNWHKNVESDLSHYTIYKAISEGFEPDSSNILITTIDTTFFDTEILDGSYYYKISATDQSGNESQYSSASVIVGVDEKIYQPVEYSLEQNYPNPFNPSTEISYSLKQSGIVTLIIYNSIGQLVANLVGEYKEAGKHTVTFDAKDFTTGVYYYKIQAGEFVETKKMILMK